MEALEVNRRWQKNGPFFTAIAAGPTKTWRRWKKFSTWTDPSMTHRLEIPVLDLAIIVVYMLAIMRPACGLRGA